MITAHRMAPFKTKIFSKPNINYTIRNTIFYLLFTTVLYKQAYILRLLDICHSPNRRTNRTVA